MQPESAPQLLFGDIDHEEFKEMSDLWKEHSLSEDARDIEGKTPGRKGLLYTLTPDCVYELAQFNKRWTGHLGAALFYKTFLTAFPDVKFYLKGIHVNVRQGNEIGVLEYAEARGTHLGEWLGISPTNRAVEFRLTIFFPWDRERKKFKGEVVQIDPADLERLRKQINKDAGWY